MKYAIPLSAFAVGLLAGVYAGARLTARAIDGWASDSILANTPASQVTYL